MKILFLNLSALKFTTATPDTDPLGGSESALCYLARALTQRGHDISLIANLPDDPRLSANAPYDIRHFPVETLKNRAFFAAEAFDAIILCNAPAAAAPLKHMAPTARLIYWAHVPADQPSIQPLAQPTTRQALDAIIFVSDWQRSEAESRFGPLSNASIIGNGIAPAFENLFASPDELLQAKQNRAAYTTLPDRGLSVLLRAMEGLERPTKLDLFTSMRVYQESDTAHAALLDEAKCHPAVALHGSVSQRELAQQLRAAAFLFYPCIVSETFCISAAEALAAGLKIVATRQGALEQTTLGYADLLSIASSDGDALVRSFRDAMRRAIDDFTADPTAWALQQFAQLQRANHEFSWTRRAAQWEQQALQSCRRK